MKRSIVYLIFLLIIQAGCKVGPKYHQPVVDSPDLFRFDSVSTPADSVINLKWWELFGNEDLKALIGHTTPAGPAPTTASFLGRPVFFKTHSVSRQAIGFTRQEAGLPVNR